MKIHLSQSIRGALRNWSRSDWEHVARDNNMTADAVIERFRIWDFEGKKVIPLNGVECEGFSYQEGCPGHEENENG